MNERGNLDLELEKIEDFKKLLNNGLIEIIGSDEIIKILMKKKCNTWK